MKILSSVFKAKLKEEPKKIPKTKKLAKTAKVYKKKMKMYSYGG